MILRIFNNFLCKWLLLFVLGCLQFQGFASVNEKSLWKNYNNSKHSVTAELNALKELSKYYSTIKGDLEAFDTITQKTMLLATQTNNEDIIIEVYDYYYSLNDYIVSQKAAYQHAQEIARLAQITGSENLLWYSQHFLSLARFGGFNFKEALLLAKKGLETAKNAGNAYFKCRSLVQIGSCYDKLDDKKEALEHFLQALDLAEKLDNDELKMLVYDAMSYMFLFNKNYLKSQEYRLRHIELLKRQPIIDTATILSDEYRLLEIQVNLGINDEVEQKIESLLKFTKQNGYEKGYVDLWSLYRSVLIDNNKFKKLQEVYLVQYPEEYKNVKENNHKLFHRLKAYFLENDKNIDSANYYWKLVIADIDKEKHLYKSTHIQLRYAEFLLRNKLYAESLKITLKANAGAIELKYLPNRIKATQILVEIYAMQGDYEKAFQYKNENAWLTLKLNEETEQEGLMILELQHQIEQRQLERLKEEQQQIADLRASKIKSNAFAGGLILFLVLSALIFRQYKQTRTEKERSDALLLNILPEQTARELKKTGVTTAHQFENVTILFGDIVGFTKIAEKLNAQNLVKEIDTYFRAFDDIMETYGLEKIKTVGDAYVAVGGMPHNNKATASDVVSAAIAMQEKVEALSKDRLRLNMPAFELRVGLHTGNVIAGVVGSKKFQYDIWGDAVNIAARMEQNSFPGKINISEDTFKRVHENFTCISRGQIEAKNKGMINMYFVEHQKNIEA